MNHLQALRRWGAAVALAFPSLVSAQSIVVDGDLTDLITFAQLDQADPQFDVTDAFASGWDFDHVYVYYLPKNDTLYVGIHLIPNGAFPGVPGDADGDRNPNGRTRLDVPQDQFGVGMDEAYLFRIDTDLDGADDGPNDILFLYRSNTTQLLRGDASGTLSGMPTEIALGVAGALVDPLIPNENRATDSIEMAIHNFSLGFTGDGSAGNPCQFGLTVFAGSLVDMLREDELDVPAFFSFPQTVTFSNEVQAAGGGAFGECVFAVPGDTITIRATIHNNGSDTLNPIWIIHQIPTGLEYVRGSVSGAVEGRSATIGGGVLIRHLRPGGDSSLSPGETETITFQVHVTSLGASPARIRGYTEGVLNGTACIFSCLDVVCVKRAGG